MEHFKKQQILSVDLDGTLIYTDLLLESFLLLIKRNLLYIFLIPVWLLKGKAQLKAQIARRVMLNVSVLPYNQGFLTWLIEQSKSGREIWLCTASNYRLANLAADHLKIFNGVLASSDTVNLSGANKANLLTSKFGVHNFYYCGNSGTDLKVWKLSNGAIIVNGSKKLQQKATTLTKVIAVFNNTHQKFIALIKVLRIHQWTKNILIFVPALAARKLNESDAIYQSLFAFLIFGICASSVYLLNDMLDLEADRLHPKKSNRPFASGALSLNIGILLAPILLVSAFLLSSLLPVKFLLSIAIYYLLTLAYTFYLKRIVLVDTIVLAGLYTIRIIAGAAAISVPLSFWLLLFSIFIFFSLALSKRFTELKLLQEKGELNAKGRGYHTEDLPILLSMGTSSGTLSVLVFALYLNSSATNVLYQSLEFLWPLCIILLFWISRLWLKTHRGEMHDDPIIFALKDRVSILCGLIAIASIFLAI